MAEESHLPPRWFVACGWVLFVGGAVLATYWSPNEPLHVRCLPAALVLIFAISAIRRHRASRPSPDAANKE